MFGSLSIPGKSHVAQNSECTKRDPGCKMQCAEMAPTAVDYKSNAEFGALHYIALHCCVLNNAVSDGCRSVSYKWDGWDWIYTCSHSVVSEVPSVEQDSTESDLVVGNISVMCPEVSASL